MKIDMSPKAIENRLQLVGELTKACLLIRQNTISKTNEKSKKLDKKLNLKSEQTKNIIKI
jgi:hypothetical protein